MNIIVTAAAPAAVVDDDMGVRTLYCELISLLVDQTLGLTAAAAER